MAEKLNLNTRIKLKYDTLTNWSTNNPVLLAGEVAVVAIPTGSESTVGQITKPAILFKVGDGTSAFNSLPYASGMAADVYSWAKAANKPEYQASEIKDLNNYINGVVQDTDTQYRLVAGAETNSWKLQSKSLNGNWSDVSGSTISVDFKALTDRLDVLETNLSTLVGNDSGKSARTIAAEETAKIVADAPEAYDTLQEIAAWIADHPEDSTAMNEQINKNKSDISLINTTLYDHEKEINSLEGSLSNLSSDLNTTISRTSALEESFNTLNENLTLSLSTLSQDLLTAKNDISDLKSKDNFFTEALNTVSSTLNTISSTLSTHALSINTLSNKIDSLGNASYHDTTNSVDTSDNLPTSSAVKTFVEGKGYTTNTGTVKSVGITTTSGGGLKVSGGPITETGNINIDIDTAVEFIFNCGDSNF